MTVPNYLTLSRILLTPLFIWCLLHGKMSAALVVFFIAGMTDLLDGFIARLFHQKSRFGAILDPLADKLLLVSSFLILGHLGLIPWWLVAIAVLRDIVIVLGTSVLFALRFQVEIRPTIPGKLTTLAQLVSVVLALSSSVLPLASWICQMAFVTTALLSLASGADYVMRGIALSRPRPPGGSGRH